MRVFATLTKVGHNYYLFGGENTTMNNSIRVLNENTWSWSIPKNQSSTTNLAKNPSAPAGRIGHTACAFNDTMIIYGGSGKNDHYKTVVR